MRNVTLLFSQWAPMSAIIICDASPDLGHKHWIQAMHIINRLNFEYSRACTSLIVISDKIDWDGVLVV